MASNATKWTIGALAAGFLTFAAVVASMNDLAELADPLVITEAEAEEIHGMISEAQVASEQTQAIFNAYTLRQILLQEITILELQIENEEDEDKRAELQDQLRVKKEFIRKLEEEERKQLIKG